MILIFKNIIAQSVPYIDKRPQAYQRMNAADVGIVIRYGDGIDSCDVYGIEEAILNEENGIYYLFMMELAKMAGVPVLQKAKIW